MKEIGSEFWLDSYFLNNNNKLIKDNEYYFLLGRTAIDVAIELLSKIKRINKVYFPSYCCQSMLQPFIDRNINIEFYRVRFQNGNLVYDIDVGKDCDLFVAMNYFGFSAYNMDFYIDKFKSRNVLVLEDSTHSYLSQRVYNEKSDMVIASLRKWFSIISGAVLINNTNIEINLNNFSYNQKYVETKKEAMEKKAIYINCGTEKKKEFLDLYNQATEQIKSNYQNYLIDEYSFNKIKKIDFDLIKQQRRENSKIIYKYLLGQYKVQYLKKVDLEKDCPIFIPIFFKNEERNNLRKWLIENKVYLPVHWPVPEILRDTETINIYNKELSLICDQRYNTTDIEDYLKIMKNFIK